MDDGLELPNAPVESTEPGDVWPVIVVGAGAAGLLAAMRAAERGRRVLLLEKMPRAGTKILMSGGTRCNVTHDTDNKGIIEAFGARGQGRFLHSALAALSPTDVVRMIEAEGVPTQVEPGRGKVFPASNQASDILEALLRRLERTDCVLALGEPLQQIERHDERFRLVTSKRTLWAEKLIVTTGGQSYPGSGTTGDGYRWLAAFGHTIVAPKPALTPITTDALWITGLRGIALADARACVIDPQLAGRQRVLAERREAVLFTHFGLSGPAILDVSRAVSLHPQPRSLRLELDLFPERSAEQLDGELRAECAEDGKRQIGSALLREMPRRLVEMLLEQAAVDPNLRAAEFSKAQRAALVATTKGLSIPISGVRGFKVAEVTAGGVALSEVDSKTMQSKLISHLFLAGEVLDLDGPIGGYNFQAAFSTAWLAGSHV